MRRRVFIEVWKYDLAALLVTSALATSDGTHSQESEKEKPRWVGWRDEGRKKEGTQKTCGKRRCEKGKESRKRRRKGGSRRWVSGGGARRWCKVVHVILAGMALVMNRIIWCVRSFLSPWLAVTLQRKSSTRNILQCSQKSVDKGDRPYAWNVASMTWLEPKWSRSPADGQEVMMSPEAWLAGQAALRRAHVSFVLCSPGVKTRATWLHVQAATAHKNASAVLELLYSGWNICRADVQAESLSPAMIRLYTPRSP